MLTRTKSVVLLSALTASAVLSAEQPTPALSSSSAAIGGSAQPLRAWVVPVAVAAVAVVTVAIAATHSDPLLPPSH